MGLEVVIDEIKAKGNQEAAKITADATATAKNIIAEATKRAEEIQRNAEEEARIQSDRIMIREVAAANLEVKRDMLNAQKELLDMVYQNAATEITNFPASIHAKVIRSLLKDAVKQIKEGYVYTNERDAEAVNSAISEMKTLSGFSFGGTIDIDGGVVVQSTNGQLTLDFSYQTYMCEVWESSLKDASGILFE